MQILDDEHRTIVRTLANLTSSTYQIPKIDLANLHMASQLFHIQWRKTIILKSIKVRLEKTVLNDPVLFKL